MYKFDANVQYKNINNEDDTYRKHLLNVFDLKEYDDKIISAKNKELYQFIKDSTQIQSIIDEISTDKYAQIFIVDKNERELYLYLLFSFEFFDLFHNCLKEYYNNKSISEKTYQLLYNAIHKNQKNI